LGKKNLKRPKNKEITHNFTPGKACETPPKTAPTKKGLKKMKTPFFK